MIIARFMIGTDHGHAGKLSLGTGHGRERHAFHAGNVFQNLLQLVQAGQIALTVNFRRQRMAAGESGQQCCTVGTPRIVLHGAGTQRIKMGINGKVAAGQIGVMAHHLHLTHFG